MRFPAVKLHVSRKSSLFQTVYIIPSLPLQILWRAGVIVGSHEVNAAAGAVAEELVPPIEGAAHDAVSSTHSGRRGAEPEAQLLCSRLQARPQLRGGCRRQIRFLPEQAITTEYHFAGQILPRVAAASVSFDPSVNSQAPQCRT